MVATSHNLDGTDLPLSDRLTNGRAECKRSWRDRMSRRGGDWLQRACSAITVPTDLGRHCDGFRGDSYGNSDTSL